MTTPPDAAATRDLEVRQVLAAHYGDPLTSHVINTIARKLIEAIERGPNSWAFRTLSLPEDEPGL